MNEFMNNSDAMRTRSSLTSPKQENEVRVQKVADGKVEKKNKPGLRELTDGFLQADAGEVRTYIWRDVLLPAFKKTLWEMITGSANMFLFHEDNAPRSRISETVSYRTKNGTPVRSSQPNRVKVVSNDFYDATFPTREKAMEAREALASAIDQYNNVTVSELYTVAGITSEYTDRYYGWTNAKAVREAEIKRIDDGYVLQMPRVKEL